MKDLKEEFYHLKPYGIVFIISLICFAIFYNINYDISMIFACIAGVTGFPFIINSLVFGIQYLGILLGRKLGSTATKMKQLDKSDFKLDKEYYREILKNNSPLILGYLDNFELDKNKVIAEILYLKMRNVISVENGRITNLANQAGIYLLKSEKKLLNIIDNHIVKFDKEDTFLNELKARIASEAEYLGLISENNNKNKVLEKISSKFKIIMYLFPLSIIIIPIIVAFVHMVEALIYTNTSESTELFYGWILMGLIIIMGIWAVLFLLMKGYEQGKGRVYKRTKKGQEINLKLEGLKNYLEDYSMLDERESKELELWDEYLVYSVMFGHNQKIIEEYEKYLEK